MGTGWSVGIGLIEGEARGRVSDDKWHGGCEGGLAVAMGVLRVAQVHASCPGHVKVGVVGF